MKNRVYCLSLLLLLIPSYCNSPCKDPEQEILVFLQKHANKAVAKDHFSGVVLFAKGERILFREAYGLADRETNRANTLNTKFNLASASKVFTAVAIAQLSEDGKLSLADPIGKFLDTTWISSDVGARVKVKHLLSHTAGFGMYWDEFDKHKDSLLSINDYRKVVSDKLAFQPGSKFEYSNTGFILLGAIIEKITGQSYDDYMGKHIFNPCGMQSTGFFRHDQPKQDMAIGYFRDREDKGKLKDNLHLHGLKGASAGGGWSTAPDMHRFILALRSDKLMKNETRELFWTQSPRNARYACGFQLGQEWVGHTGGFPGIEAFVHYFPQPDYVLIVLSNYYDSAVRLDTDTQKFLAKLIKRCSLRSSMKQR